MRNSFRKMAAGIVAFCLAVLCALTFFADDGRPFRGYPKGPHGRCRRPEMDLASLSLSLSVELDSSLLRPTSPLPFPRVLARISPAAVTSYRLLPPSPSTIRARDLTHTIAPGITGKDKIRCEKREVRTGRSEARQARIRWSEGRGKAGRLRIAPLPLTSSRTFPSLGEQDRGLHHPPSVPRSRIVSYESSYIAPAEITPLFNLFKDRRAA